jgi:hypothetical protein
MITKLGLSKGKIEIVISEKHKTDHDLVIEVNNIMPNKTKRIGLLLIDRSHADCLDTFEISWAHMSYNSRKYLGFGPMMYEVAMEYITQKYNVGLTCDRQSVSEFAYPVWEKFLERSKSDPEITTELLDFDAGPEEKKFTPGNKSDDCWETTSLKWYREKTKEHGWSDDGPTDEFRKYYVENDPTSRTYKKSPARTIKILKDLGMLKIQ